MHRLRQHALSHSLFGPTSIKPAVEQLGFVQADPIRSPATAQDLILRQRVEGYRVGDLGRAYAELELEEGVLYAYGFMRRDLWRLRQHEYDAGDLPEFEQKVLAAVRRDGPVHPGGLVEEFGAHRVVNAWGGNSRAVAKALDDLLWYGLLRVTSRQKGIRVYEAAPPPAADRGGEHERFRRLLMADAHILAPVQEGTLASIGSQMRRRAFPNAQPTRAALQDMIKGGELEERTVDGIRYLWPMGTAHYKEAPRMVRLLAPFDPVVWCRRRFEHFWRWEYRFEAYTPKEKRVRGYYALPMLWGEEIIGWANVSTISGRFEAEVGYVGKQPREKGFTRELRLELERLEWFLGTHSSA